MKKRLLSAFGFLMLCLGVTSQTNIANYTFAKSVGAYTPITGGTVFRAGTFDQEITTAIPISFPYGGVTQTQLFITANGYITFGSAPSTTNYTPLSAGTYSGAISAMGCDLAQAASGSPEIRYETIGNEFIAQFQDARRYNNTGERISFQIRLNTSTGEIKIVYGGTITSGSTQYGREIGIRGATTNFNTNVNNVMTDNVPTATTCNWNDAVTGSSNASTMYFYNTNTNIVPVNGLTFTWAPPVAPVAPVRAFAAVSAIGSTSATLSWTAPSGATQYNVQYRVPGTCAWTNFSGNPVMTNSVNLTGLAVATIYQARVQSSDGTNNAIWSHIPNAAGSGSGYSSTGTFSTTVSCPAPTGVGINNISATAANYTWTAGTGTAWDVYYGPTPLTAPTASTVPTATTATNSYSATGLTAGGTQYAVYIRSNCGPGDVSTWTAVTNFNTLCNSTNIPYVQDFESVTVPAIPNCTSIQNAGSGNNWTTSSPAGFDFLSKTLTYIWNGSNAGNAWFYTQGLNLTAGVSYRLTYRYGCNDADYVERLRVCYGASAINTAMTTTLATHSSVTNDVTSITNTIDFIPSSTGVYYIGFNAYSIADQNRLYVDDINVQLTPTCFPPTALTTTNITTATADISWTAPALGTPANYIWEVRTSGAPGSGATGLAANGSVAAPTTSATATGLSVLTSYSLYVSTDCGGGDMSVWAPVKTFTTMASCPVPTGLNVSSVTATSAVSTWTAGASETAWDVYYGVSPLTPPTAGTVPTVTTSVTNYSLTGLTPSTGYTIYVRANCGAGNTSIWTPQVTFVTPCLPPNIVTTAAGTRCGTGTTTLTATADMGGTVNWYAGPTGGSAIATGTLLTTPSISVNTTYYVSASSPGGIENAGRPTPGTTTGYLDNNTGLVFDATVPFVIQSAVVYPVGTGSIAVAIQNSTGTELTSTAPIAVSGNGSTPVTIPLNLSVTPGTNYRLVTKSNTGITDLVRDGSIGGYPYNSPSGAMSITSGYFIGTSSSYYYFYNIQLSAPCSSTRTAVTATVSTAPVVSATTGTTICTNAVQALNITSTVGDYDNYIWSPATNLYTDAAATIPYAGGSATTVYYMSGVNGNTAYMINANNTMNGCVNSASLTMGATMPSVMASANPTIVCSGTPVDLTANTMVVTTGTASVGTATGTTSGSGASGGSYISPFSHYFGGYKAQHIIRASELNAAGFVAGNISALSLSVTSVGTTYTDFAISMATTTQSVATTTFIGSLGTVYGPNNVTPTVGLNTYNFSTPFNWDGTSNVVVQICWSNNNGGGTASEVRYVTPGYTSGVYYRGDNETSSAMCGQTTGAGTLLSRPYMIFAGQKGAMGAGTVTWQWNPGAINSNTTTVTPVNMGASPATESYTVTAIDPVTTCSNSAVVSFTVKPNPTVNASANNTLVCAGSPSTLTATGATSYSWTAGGNNPDEVVMPTSNTTYTVTGTDNGCTGTATVSVDVNALPAVNATASQTILCDDGSTGSSVLTANTAATSFTWSTGDNTQTSVVTPSMTTTYTVTVNDGTCDNMATVTVTVSNCTGIKDAVANGINVYPNPNNGVVNFAVASGLTGNTTVEIYDAIGKLVIKENLTKEITTISTSHLEDGVYFFKIKNNNQEVKVGKMIKH